MNQPRHMPFDDTFSIFISYRRDDTSGHAGHLYSLLNDKFPGQVFMDIDKIEYGEDFVEVIKKTIETSNILIVLIGREWLTITDANGKRRLDNADDIVHVEIATALGRNKRIIPVLVEGARMPRQEELPAQLQSLARRHAIEITDSRLAHDVERLVRALKKDVSALTSKKLVLIVSIITCVIVLGILGYKILRSSGVRTPDFVGLHETFDNYAAGKSMLRGNLYDAYIEDGRYIMETKTDATSCEMLPTRFPMRENFDVEVTTTWIAGVKDQGYGLAFGVDPGNRYLFGLTANAQGLVELYLKGKGVEMPVSWKPSSARRGDGFSGNRLKVQKRREKITYFVNDEHMGAISISPSINLNEWVVGVTVSGKQRVAFDNLIVTPK
jgi:TIR domain